MSLLTWAGETWRRLTRDVVIFWDYDNCPFPTSAEQEDVVRRVEEEARRFGTVKFLRAYTLPLKPGQADPKETFNSPKRALKICPSHGKREVVDKAILLEMLLHAFDTRDRATTTTIVLITGDGDFVEAIEQLKERRFEIVVIAPFQCHTRLSKVASFLLDYKTVLGVPAKEPVKAVLKLSPQITVVDPTPKLSPQVTVVVPTPKLSPQVTISDPTPKLSPQVAVSDPIPKSSPQVTISDPSPKEPPESQQENNSNSGSDSGLLYDAEDLTTFEPLIACLLRYRYQGYSTPYRAMIGGSLAQLVKSDPEVYQRAGCRAFRDYIKCAEDLCIVICGRSGPTDWIMLDPDLVEQMDVVARIRAASQESW